jgi:hypothetical protein
VLVAGPVEAQTELDPQPPLLVRQLLMAAQFLPSFEDDEYPELHAQDAAVSPEVHAEFDPHPPLLVRQKFTRKKDVEKKTKCPEKTKSGQYGGDKTVESKRKRRKKLKVEKNDNYKKPETIWTSKLIKYFPPPHVCFFTPGGLAAKVPASRV